MLHVSISFFQNACSTVCMARGASLSRLQDLVTIFCQPKKVQLHWATLSRLQHNDIYLVLGCIEAEFYVQIFIFQHFSRSTRSTYLCTAPYSKFADFFEFFVKKWWIFEIFANFWWNLLKSAFFRRKFHGFLSELREMLNKFQKCRKNMQKFAKLHEKWWNFADFP